MILKAVFLFLVAIVALGIFGKLRYPRMPGRKRERSIQPARKCRECGVYVVDSTPCARADCPYAKA